MSAISKLMACASASAFVTAGASGASAQQLASTDQASEESGPSAVDEIVVTARKVSERVIDVPSAISVISGESMLSSGATSFQDLVGLVPGLQFTKTVGTGSPVIRGVTDGVDNAPTVAIVVDGASIGTSSKLASGGANTLDLDPFDIARVEVLKGPQGTLYGANTLGGILSYTLATPSLTEVEGVARSELASTEHGDPSYSIRGAVSTPLVDGTAGLRLSGYVDRRGGFIDNQLLDRDDANDSDIWGVHGALLVQPNDALSVNLHVFHQQTTIDQGDLVPYLATAQTTPRDEELLYNEFLPFGARKRVTASIANIGYDFDFATLTSVTSYQDFYLDSQINATAGALRGLLVNTVPLFGGPTFPAPGLLEIDVQGGSTKFTQELRFAYGGKGPFTGILGGYYARERTHGYIPVFGVTTAAQPIASLNPAIFFDLPSTLNEQSVFANVTYQPTSSFEVTGGIRYGEIDQTFRQLFYGTAVPAYNAFLTFFGVNATPADTGITRSSETETTYLATAAWHFKRNGMVYARYATGFRPGGPNVQVIGLKPTFESDSTENYEVGLKAQFLDGRGSAEIAGYYTPWENIQIGVTSGGITGFGNGGDAEIRGVEAQASFQVMPQLTVSGAFNYAHGEITRADPGSSLTVGSSLLGLPRYSGAVNVEYRAPIRGEWQAHGSVLGRYNGSRYGSAAPLVELPDYTLLDLHAGVGDARYTIDLYVDNVTDKRAQLAAYTGYGNFAFVQRPRTYGLSLTARF